MKISILPTHIYSVFYSQDILYKCWLILFIFLCASSLITLNAQVIWEGNTDSDWSNYENWFDHEIPGPNDDVTIPNTAIKPTIKNGTMAVAQSILVESGAELTIQASGTLDIDGASTNALRNKGTVNNSGTIIITNSTEDGIYNEATFNNNTGGNIQIDGVDVGIHNYSGTFTNAANIISEGCQYGIWNKATFNNNTGGNIQIDDTSSDGIWNVVGTFTNEATIKIGVNIKVRHNGLANLGVFDNNVGGNIHIDETGGNGIWNVNIFNNNGGSIYLGENKKIAQSGIRHIGKEFNNTAGGVIQIDEVQYDAINIEGPNREDNIFNNSATIVIGLNKKPHSGGMRILGSTFNNNVGGVIQIEETTNLGIGISLSDFNNHATITIGLNKKVGTYGIINSDNFNNHIGGLIQIEETGKEGIYNDDDFTNMGTITIGANTSPDADGVQNEGTFKNEVAGELLIRSAGQRGILNGGNADLFENKGIIEIDDTGQNSSLGEGIYSANPFVNIGQILIGQNGTFNNEAIENINDFTNQGCTALLHLFSDIISNTGTFDNEGTIIENASGDSNISDNTGVIQNLNGGTFTIDSGNSAITNTGQIWTGCTDTNWDNPQNWHNQTVPTASDNATIPDRINDPIIQTGTTAMAQSVTVQTNAECTLQSGSILNIEGATGDGFLNNGTCSNSGAINIGITGSVGAHGLRNNVTFTNEVSGTIQVGNTTASGILNISGGSFTNKGGVLIGQNGGNIGTYGIYNLLAASFINDGSQIDIDNAGIDGVSNIHGAVFTNINNAQLNIGQNDGNIGQVGIFCGFSGIVTNDGASIKIGDTGNALNNFNHGLFLQTNGTFTNKNAGEILIGQNSKQIKGAGVLINISSQFLNESATIEIDNTTFDGLLVGGDCSFTNQSSGQFLIGQNEGNIGRFGIVSSSASGVQIINDGSTIQVDNTSSDGILSRRSFINQNAGQILIGQNGGNIGGVGFNCESTNSNFTNDASTVFIDAGAAGGLLVSGTLDNKACAVLSVNQNLSNSGDIINEGLISFNTSNTHTNTGTFTNEGILHHVEDNPIPNVTNNEIIVQPTVSPNCSSVNPTFDLGNPIDFIFHGIFMNPSGSYSVGSYNANTNTFTPTSGLSEGSYDYFVKIEDNAGGCTNILPWKLTIDDTVKPEITCPANITKSMDAGTCSAIVTWATPSVSDNCDSNPTETQTMGDPSGSAFSGGTHTIEYKAVDDAGNEEFCQFTITIDGDIEKPNAQCQTATVELDSDGEGSITVSDIDNNSTDNCTIDTYELDITDFDCEDVGNVTVTLTVTDESGNSEECTATVTIQDNIKPNAQCQIATVELDADGEGSITASDIDNNSNDVCGIKSLSLDKTDFDCDDLGSNTVTLTVTDENDNEETCTATVTVEDKLKPQITCPSNITKPMDAGTCSAVVTWTAPTASDNCDSDPTETQTMGDPSGSAFSGGTHTIEYKAVDDAGNEEFCQFTITIDGDTEAPVLSGCPSNISKSMDAGECGAVVTWTAPSATDNCDTDPTVTQIQGDPSGSQFSAGTHTLKYTSTDNAGNESLECSFTISIDGDSEKPNAQCQNQTVELDIDGNASISASQIDNNSTDNCGIQSRILDISEFDCDDLGTVTVNLTITDLAGNFETCSATVTVEDNIAPVAFCQFATVELDANGEVTVQTSEVYITASENCDIQTVELSQSNFDCSNLGVNIETVTATDYSGNSDDCITYVTVEDKLNPTAICQNKTIELDSNGEATLTGSDVDDGSTDNCGIDSYELSKYNFNCSDIGTQNVTLTVKDESQNEHTCTAEVTVEDNEKPNAICQNITVELDASGTYNLTTGEVNNGSSDNCSIDNLSVSPNNFDCSDVGATPVVTLTITDNEGNEDECTATVTVEDNTAPEAKCKNAVIELDSNGNATVEVSDIDDNSTDNCDIQSMELDLTNFNCFQTGVHEVKLEVTDNQGNMSECFADVTIEDNEKPEAKCKNFTATCSGGEATISVADINDGSSDNCNFTMELDQTVLDCSNATATVILTATDNSGNTDECTAVVTLPGSSGPTLSINDVSKLEGNFFGFTFYMFAVTRSGSTNTTSVEYATADGTATVLGNDYLSASGTLHWSNGGSDVKYVLVLVKKDNIVEPDEIFTVNLSNPGNGATISDGEGEGEILNDDGSTVIGNNDPTGQISEREIKAELTLYPNPTKDLLNIKIRSELIENEPLKGIVFDNSGREIQNFDILDLNTERDVSKLRSGMYFLTVFKNEKAVISKRFVKTD